MRVEKSLVSPDQHGQVVRIADVSDLPAVAEKAGRHVLRKGDAGWALNGDVVIVVDPTEVGKLEVTGQGRRLTADPFHHAAVPAKGIHVVVEQIVAGTIVSGRQPALRDSHADAHRNALSERPRRRLHA
jgi:hypothetical protein